MLNWSAPELARLDALKNQVQEYRALAPEVDLANERLPELRAEQRRSTDALAALPPSRLIAFGDEVVELVTSLRRAELLIPALSASASKHHTRLAVLAADIRRAVTELTNGLRLRIVNDLRGEDREKFRPRAHATDLPGATWPDRANALLALCRELGADVPTPTTATE